SWMACSVSSMERVNGMLTWMVTEASWRSTIVADMVWLPCTGCYTSRSIGNLSSYIIARSYSRGVCRSRHSLQRHALLVPHLTVRNPGAVFLMACPQRSGVGFFIPAAQLAV